MVTSGETLITFSQAAKRFPGAGGRESVNHATVWRWARKGCRASNGQIVRLRVSRAGSRWFTSHQAIDEFISALSEIDGGNDAVLASPAARRRDAEQADRELTLAGV